LTGLFIRARFNFSEEVLFNIALKFAYLLKKGKKREKEEPGESAPLTGHNCHFDSPSSRKGKRKGRAIVS